MYFLVVRRIYRPPGKPTKLAPIPNPAPERAVTPITGTYVSRMLKVAAAVNAIIPISSKFKDLLGMAYAAKATIKPSTRYFIILFTNSLMSKTRFIILNR